MKRKIIIFLCYVTPIILLCYVGLLIFKPGHIIYIDVTEQSSMEKIKERYLFTYSDGIGQSLAEKARIPLFYLIYMLYSLLRLQLPEFVKIKILALFALSIAAMVITTNKLLVKASNKKSVAALIASVMAGIYFVTNYWFSNRIVHFGLFFSTVSVPITFYFVYTYFYNRETSFKRLLVLALLHTILTPTPHAALFEVLIIFSITISFVLRTGVNIRGKLIKLSGLVLFGFAYLLFNSFWILPFLSSSVAPDAIPSSTMVKFLGKNATLENAIRLTGFWNKKQSEYFHQDYSVSVVQNVISYFPIGIAILTLIYLKIKRIKIFLPLATLLLLGISFSTLEKPTESIYNYLMFYSPVKDFGWVFREVDKFGIIISFGYSLLIAFGLYHSRKSKVLFPILLLSTTAIILTNGYFLKTTLETNYKPQEIPEEYFHVVDILEEDHETFNVIWYPGVTKPYWSSTEEVPYVFGNLTSPKPTITTRSDGINYAESILSPSRLEHINSISALSNLGVKYIVIRNDEVPGSVNASNSVLENKGNEIKKIFSGKYLNVYENTTFNDISNYCSTIVKTNRGLGIFDNEDIILSGNHCIDFTDKPSELSTGDTYYSVEFRRYSDFAINKFYDKFIYPAEFTTEKLEGSQENWGVGSLENLKHAETHHFFWKEGFEIHQFDYGKGIVAALSNTSFFQGDYEDSLDDVNLTFSLEQNDTTSSLTYTLQNPDKNQWVWLDSNPFPLYEANAIYVTAESRIDRDLEPHFKVHFIDIGGSPADTIILFPDIRNRLNRIIRVPEEQVTHAVVSIWNRPTDQTLNVTNASAHRITAQLKPLSTDVTTNTQCAGECFVLARILRSHLGGKMRLDIDENILIANTNNNVYSKEENKPIQNVDRYDWINLGKVDIDNDITKIVFTNISGINSVNSLVFLTPYEYDTLKLAQKEVEEKTKKEFVDNFPQKPNLSTKRINPTMYEITVHEPIEREGILTFAKLYDDNWILNGQEARVINGLSNGWYFDKLDAGTYIVEYKPQRYFYVGSIISITYISAALGYLILDSVVKRSWEKTRSNSQG